jgi:cytochrome c
MSFRIIPSALIAAGVCCATVAQAAGDATKGSRLFLQCRACHTVDPALLSGVGPNLSGVTGAKAGTRPGYVFSKALSGSGIVWTPTTLDAWLKRPSALVPGSKMAFAGIAAPQARQDVIAYLATLKGKKAGK